MEKYEITQWEHGFYCTFKTHGKWYFAEILRVNHYFVPYTDCAIYEYDKETEQLADIHRWGGIGDFPVTKESLIECIEEFIEDY